MNGTPHDPIAGTGGGGPTTITYARPSLAESIRASSQDAANEVAKMRAIQAAYPDSVRVQELGGTFDGKMTQLRLWTAGSLGIPVDALGAGGFPVSTPDGRDHQLYHWSPWDELEEKTTWTPPGFRLAESSL